MFFSWVVEGLHQSSGARQVSLFGGLLGFFAALVLSDVMSAHLHSSRMLNLAAKNQTDSIVHCT